MEISGTNSVVSSHLGVTGPEIGPGAPDTSVVKHVWASLALHGRLLSSILRHTSISISVLMCTLRGLSNFGGPISRIVRFQCSTHVRV